MSNQQYSTALTKVNDTFLPMIESQFSTKGLQVSEYGKQCVLNALSSINQVLDTNSLSFNSEGLDKSQLTGMLMQIAKFELNAAASPREIYFQIRKFKVKGPDNKDIWKQRVEMGIEGDGNDAILSRFGRNVKQVRPFWLVREGDDFEYPSFNGLEMTMPKWTPKGKGKIVRVVYPIILNDNSIQFLISEREDVAANLLAHINNNMMNETFGFAKSRYDATADEKRKIEAKKTELVASVKGKSLDDILATAEIQPWISPAWLEPQSSEAMIIRKMRNNAVKKFPKDFGSGFVERLYDEMQDHTEYEVMQEISEQANSIPIDVTSHQTPNAAEESGQPATQQQSDDEEELF